MVFRFLDGGAGGGKGGRADPRPCLPLSSVLAAMGNEEEESPSSSEEEAEEEEDVPLDSDMEQVSRKNTATSSAQASMHPAPCSRPGRNP